MYSRRHFPNQKPNEYVLMFLRRHWIAVFKIIAINVCLAVMPVVFYIGLATDSNFFERESVLAIFTLLVSAVYLFIILYAFANFVDYYLDVWVVTNQRVINIEQKGLFARVISEKDLGRMQDVTSEVKGFWATLLNYGDVNIQTAGEQTRFNFRQIPYADEVARRISNLAKDYKKLNKDIEFDDL